jgi:hypothetical protein
MKGYFIASALALAALMTFAAPVQGQTITVTPKTDPNPPNPQPGAGEKAVYAEGKFTLAAGQTVDKVNAKWYKEVGGNLILVGQASDIAPGRAVYKTFHLNVPTHDAAGNQLQYTVIVDLYVVGQMNPVASNVAQHYTP